MAEIIIPQGIVGQVLRVGQMIQDGRSSTDVFLQLSEEVGELSTELSIEKGYSKKAAGPDKIPGEVADIIICAIDLLYVACGWSEEQIEEKIRQKLQKWLNKSV